MAKMNPPSLASRIDAVEIKQERRPHLGGSQIGHKCKRYLWYTFHWAYENHINTKSNRIFRIGDCAEDLIVADLARVGKFVTAQQRRVTGLMGHCGGSTDGQLGHDTLFEAKSMNVSNYNKLKREGVKEGFPIYYAQLQYYMGYLGMSNALFISMNKNTQELWPETVQFDKERFEELKLTEKQIIYSESPDEFERIGPNRSWHECRFCPANGVCHEDEPILRTCRSCKFSDPVENGVWKCMLKGTPLSMHDQLEGCGKYKG